MIYTVTLNPSIDYIVRLDQVQVGSVNRMDSDDKFAGGKGINVSRVLKRLDIPNTATGFIGGFTGKFITDTLAEEEIETCFVQVAEDTRINVKIKADQETEINGTGPNVEPAQLEELKAILSSLTAEDTVVFAGSSAKNLGNVIYKDLIALTRKTGAQVVCDFEGQTLIDSLDYQPLLVKPNNHELGAIFGVKLESLDEIENYARQLLAKGAQNVIISMAGDGALLVTSEGAYFAKPIKGTVKNSVGAGDSMVAGFTGEFVKSKDAVEAFKWGVACGTATTLYRHLNQVSVVEPDILFIGDSIVEYYPLQELFGTAKTIVNRGIRGYQTGLLLENLDAHLYGGAVDKIVLLIGTNDIGKDVPVNEALNNLESIIQSIARDYPLTEIKLLSILPVNEGEEYKQTVYIRTNEKIQKWNQAYKELSSAYMQVEFAPVFDSLTDQAGQLKKDYTTDGLHLSVPGYQVLTKSLKDYLL